MNPTRAEELLQQLFDGTIQAADARELALELDRSPAMRRSYLDFVLLETVLQIHGERVIDPGLPMTPMEPTVDEQLRRWKRRGIMTSAVAAAAIIVALATVLHLISIRNPPPVLSWATAPDSKVAFISDPAGSPDPNILRSGDTVRLDQGTIELRFHSGVRSVITGPATLTVNSPGRIHLQEGSAWFDVPHDATGFQVRTPGLLLTDRGTRFGVISVPKSSDEVHVFKGRVDVESLIGRREARSLSQGESCVVDPIGRLADAPQLAVPFETTLPSGLRYLHFSFDEADPAAVGGSHPALGGMRSQAIQSDQRAPASRSVPGRFGKGLLFDGKGDMIQTNWPGVYGRTPLTLAFWFKATGRTTFGGVLGWGLAKQESLLPNQWKILLAPLRRDAEAGAIFRAAWGQQSMAGAEIPLLDDTWHHLAVVFTGDAIPTEEWDLNFYLDGRPLDLKRRLPSSPPVRPADLLAANPMTIGKGPSPEGQKVPLYFQGLLDELFIVEGALTADQIRELRDTNTFTPRSENP